MRRDAIVYPILTALLSVLLVVGCAASDLTAEVECDNGQIRDIACGVRGNGVQQQLCVDYQWTNDGACDDPTECLADETRQGTTSCGLNDRGTLREQCNRGVWTSVAQIGSHPCAADEDPQSCACSDPDECMDGDLMMEACGIEQSGEQALLCTEGKWILDGGCQGAYECVAPDSKTEMGACGLNGRGEQSFVCNEAGMWERTECEDADSCVDGSSREVECTDQEGGNGLPRIREILCENGKPAEGECRDSKRCILGAKDIVVCGTEGNYSGEAERVCAEEGVWEPLTCWQQARFLHEAPYGLLIRAESQELLTVGDNRVRTAGTSILEDEEYLFPTPTHAVDAREMQKRFSASTSHQCGVNNLGILFCWGDNTYGQLGTNATEDPIPDPTSVTIEGRQIQAVSVGEGFSCALTTDGAVYCWGRNDQQQLGRDDAELASSQTPVEVLDGARAIAAGEAHVCALKGNEVYCWGANDVNQAAESEDLAIRSPTLHDKLSHDPGRDDPPPNRGRCEPTLEESEIRGLSAGQNHTLVSWRTEWRRQAGGLLSTCAALLTDVTYRTDIHVIGVGSNAQGQLGKSTSASVNAPTSLASEQFSSAANVQFVPRANGDVSCLLREQDGAVVEYLCTGDNSQGQLSDAEGHVTALTPLPADLSDGEEIAQLAIGFDSLCVLLEDSRRIGCRGGNDYGQLGDGTTESRRESAFMLHEVNADD